MDTEQSNWTRLVKLDGNLASSRGGDQRGKTVAPVLDSVSYGAKLEANLGSVSCGAKQDANLGSVSCGAKQDANLGSVSCGAKQGADLAIE